MKRPRPKPPFPNRKRVPRGGFGWLDDRLLHDRWLSELGPDAITVLVFLALAADRYGASFYGRMRMVAATGIPLSELDKALAKLTDRGLVAFRPWRNGASDGVWQLLDLPRPRQNYRAGKILTVAQVLNRLGIGNAD